MSEQEPEVITGIPDHIKNPNASAASGEFEVTPEMEEQLRRDIGDAAVDGLVEVKEPTIPNLEAMMSGQAKEPTIPGLEDMMSGESSEEGVENKELSPQEGLQARYDAAKRDLEVAYKELRKPGLSADERHVFEQEAKYNKDLVNDFHQQARKQGFNLS